MKKQTIQNIQRKPSKLLWFYNEPPTENQVATATKLDFLITIDPSVVEIFNYPITCEQDRKVVLTELAKIARRLCVEGFCGMFSPIWQELMFRSTLDIMRKGTVQTPENGMGDFLCISPFLYGKNITRWCVVGYITIDELFWISLDYRN